MSQTDEAAPNSSEEKIRKVYAKDLKIADTVHTVFKAAGKTKVTSRAGKTFLTLALVDRTGEVDSRVFDNVEAAEHAFRDDDYLLVKGKVISFHGKPQLVVDTLERLDPGPIDAAEFTWTPAPPEPKPERPEPRHEAPARGDKGGNRSLRNRVLALLDDPQIAHGAEALLKHLEAWVDERVAQRLGQAPAGPREPKKPFVERRPKIDRGPRAEEGKPEAAPRDGSLPKDLTFKPLSMLAGEPAPAENSPKPEGGP